VREAQIRREPGSPQGGGVISVITENEGQYFFYKGADTKVGSNAVLRDADLERLKAAVQKLV
jgi:hypothetical protein